MSAVAVSYSDELTAKFKSMFSMPLFSDVKVTSPFAWCYNKDCKHPSIKYDTEHSSHNQLDKNNSALSCDKRITEVNFEYIDCSFRLETRCDFLHVTQLWVTKRIGPMRSEIEINYRRNFADWAEVGVKMQTMLNYICCFNDIMSLIVDNISDV